MIETLTKEFLSSWNDSDVQAWRNYARWLQQLIYLLFHGSQFHDITELSEDSRIDLICFAIFSSLPSEERDPEAGRLMEKAYSKDQRKIGAGVYQKILEEWESSSDKKKNKKFRLGFIFIFCKKGSLEYQEPLFNLLWSANGDGTYESRYIDTSLRVYQNDEDWKTNNQNQMMKYCHPTDLVYTCNSEGGYEFDAEREVSLGFHTSPACDTVARVNRVIDNLVFSVLIATAAATETETDWVHRYVILVCEAAAKWYLMMRAMLELEDDASHGESSIGVKSIRKWIYAASFLATLFNDLVFPTMQVGVSPERISSDLERLFADILFYADIGLTVLSIILYLYCAFAKKPDSKLAEFVFLDFQMFILFFTNTVVGQKPTDPRIQEAKRVFAEMRDCKGEHLREKVSEIISILSPARNVEIVREYRTLI